MVNLFEVQDERIWDASVSSQTFAPFTQSWAWGEFQQSLGRRVLRVMAHDAHAVPILACQLVYQTRRFGFGYWFAPRGPVFKTGDLAEQAALAGEAVQAIREKCAAVGKRGFFIRFEPLMHARLDLSAAGLIRTHAMDPATTRILTLQKSEEELLAEMHPKTRYNIRVAQKYGVTIRVAEGEKDLEIFLRLMDETAARDRLISHPRNYLAATWRFLSKKSLCCLRLAEQGGKALAAQMEMAFGDTTTYLHGASSSEQRSFMAPYALQWEAIRTAKAEGRSFYDFWGCNPEDKGDLYYAPRWEGITRFKRGWGGELVHFVGTWDAPYYPIAYRLLMGLKSRWIGRRRICARGKDDG